MAAEGLAVLLGDLATFGGLLDREADATTGRVEFDDLDPQFLTGRDDLVGRLHVVRGHLRDVHESFNALAHLDERSEGYELGDATVDQLVDRVTVGEDLPGVGLRGLQGERDALLGEVDVQDLDVDLVTDGHDLARVIDVLPTEFRDVNESVHAAEVHEGAEVDDRGDDAVAAFARLEVREEVATLFLLGLFEPGPT